MSFKFCGSIEQNYSQCVKFQILYQDIQKNPKLECRFLEWVNLWEVFTDRSDYLLFQYFMWLDRKLDSLVPKVPSKTQVLWNGMHPHVEKQDLTQKLWKN